MRHRVFALTLLIASASPLPAAADWLISPYIGVRFAADTTLLVGVRGTERTKSTLGASFGLLSDGIFGIEGDIAFVPGYFDRFGGLSGSRVTTMMANGIVAVPIERSQYGLRPYAIAGAGYVRARAATGSPEVDVLNLDVFGMNVGGGAIGPLTERTSARFDLRYFRSLGGDEAATTISGAELEFSFWRASVGLTFRF